MKTDTVGIVLGNYSSPGQRWKGLTFGISCRRLGINCLSINPPCPRMAQNQHWLRYFRQDRVFSPRMDLERVDMTAPHSFNPWGLQRTWSLFQPLVLWANFRDIVILFTVFKNIIELIIKKTPLVLSGKREVLLAILGIGLTFRWRPQQYPEKGVKSGWKYMKIWILSIFCNLGRSGEAQSIFLYANSLGTWKELPPSQSGPAPSCWLQTPTAYQPWAKGPLLLAALLALFFFNNRGIFLYIHVSIKRLINAISLVVFLAAGWSTQFSIHANGLVGKYLHF